MKSNIEQLKIAEKYLGDGGSKFRRFCGMKSGPYCNAFVSYIFYEAENKSLYCNGARETYCPHSISWCYKHLASIPLYLALPSDVIYFDWNLNGDPNHIGFVRERKKCDEIYTVEGNTDKLNSKGKVVASGVVANRTRSAKYVQAVFRPHFKATYTIGKLEIDGLCGYNTIAMLQTALGVQVDGILGQGTVKALQRRAGVKADGLWGKNTSKAAQKMIGVKADGLFGPDSVKALQKWINNKVYPQHVKNKGEKIAETALSYKGKVPYKKGGTDITKAVDCTGFVQEIYRLNGIPLKASLKSWGKSIGTNIKKALPGDIVSFNSKKTGKLKHHGIYVGNGEICHATSGKKVCVSDLPLYGLKIEGIRRRWK